MRDGTANDLIWNGCGRMNNAGWVVSRSGMRIAYGKLGGTAEKFLASENTDKDES